MTKKRIYIAGPMRDALKKSRDYFAALREVVAGCPSEKNLSLRIKEIDAALSGDLEV